MRSQIYFDASYLLSHSGVRAGLFILMHSSRHHTVGFYAMGEFQDAEGLWETIKEEQGNNKWRSDLEEKYEDREGNVFDRKTFTELQMQGLI